MRFTSITLTLAIVAVSFVAVPEARAQYVDYDPGYYTYYYTGPIYSPPVYYTPGVYTYGASVSPYYHSANYYVTPRARVWSYGSYYPYTNQYQFYYGYRTYPPRFRR